MLYRRRDFWTVEEDFGIFQPQSRQIVNLDDFQPLSNCVEDQFEAVLGKVHDQVHFQGIFLSIEDFDLLQLRTSLLMSDALNEFVLKDSLP